MIKVLRIRLSAGRGAQALPPRAVLVAAIALLTHALNAGRLVRTMELQPGVAVLDPLAGAAYSLFGPPGPAVTQLVIVLAGTLICLELARRGRVRLALSCLSASAMMGVFQMAMGVAWPV